MVHIQQGRDLMVTWVVGDIHGCYRSFEALLEQLQLQQHDRLICVGDLINRGPDSAAVLDRFMTDPQLSTVLGNHDCAYLFWAKGEPGQPDSLFDDLAQHPHHSLWLDFLTHSPLMIEHSHGIVAHAGLWPWAPLHQQRKWAAELSTWMQNALSDQWQQMRVAYRARRVTESLQGPESDRITRLCALFGVFTKMRYVDTQSRAMDFRHKGYPLIDMPGLLPWFEAVDRDTFDDPRPILFGHWSALEGLLDTPGTLGLDTGCVWGGSLTAYCLESGVFKSQKRLEVEQKIATEHSHSSSAAQPGTED